MTETVTTPAATTTATPAATVADPAQTTQQTTTPATTVETAPTTPTEPASEAIGAATEAPAATGYTFQPTGDAGLDLTLGFIGKLGIGAEDAAVVAAQDGKFELLEAKLAAMGDKADGYENYVALAKQAYERTSNDTKAKQTAITSAVTEAAGGADTWTAVKTWAGQNATPEEKAEINAMLEAGPVQARAAAQMLLGLYQNAGGTVVTPTSALAETAGNPSNTGNGALSPAEYTSAVRDLRGKLGNRMEGSPEYNALIARRRAWQG